MSATKRLGMTVAVAVCTLASQWPSVAEADVPFHAEIKRARKRLFAKVRKWHKVCLGKAKQQGARKKCLEGYRKKKAPIAKQAARLARKARQARLKCRQRHDTPANLLRCRKKAWAAFLKGLQRLARR